MFVVCSQRVVCSVAQSGVTLSQPGGQRCVQYWAEQGSWAEPGQECWCSSAVWRGPGIRQPDNTPTLPGAAPGSPQLGSQHTDIPANGGAQPRHSLCLPSRLTEAILLGRNTTDLNRPRNCPDLTLADRRRPGETLGCQ